MRPLGTPGLLATIALRNLFRHTGKSLIVGSILVFGTLLLVLGTSLLDSVERSMQESVTGSISGHLQLYSSKAKDSLDLFGGSTTGRPEIGHIPDFAVLREAIADVPGVKAVVPMGLNEAMANSGTELDRWLESLRGAVRDGDAGRAAEAEAHIRQILVLITEENTRASALLEESDELETAAADLARAGSPEFWAGFAAAPEDALEFLENRIAPLSNTEQLMFLRYLGTDLDLFARTFEKFEIVKGGPVPEGRRGFLLNQKFHEDYVKNLVARELDGVRREREAGKRIADDVGLGEKVRRLSRQYQRITFQLDGAQTKALDAALAEAVPDATGTLEERLQAFLLVDDENFDRRYRFFYDRIAPLIRLYNVDVGDVLTVTGFTRSGYVKTLAVKIYGTFRFHGIERSDLAGYHNLVDLATFRDLLGLMTAEKRAELDAIRSRVGVAHVAREDAEAALFGGDATVEPAAADGESLAGIEDAALAGLDRSRDWDLPVTRQDREAGVILNAAVVLDDPARLPEVKAELERRIAARGLEVQAVDWQTAAGLVGQFISVVRAVLYVALLIIFGVALVILNNTMVMATMERTNEIGTMRAIGAGRRFVVAMLLAETVALGVVAGAIGAALGALVVRWLGAVGIPAGSDILVFLFGGPRLHPAVSPVHLVGALFLIFVVSLFSTLYPAWIATRVQPIEAMRSEE